MDRSLCIERALICISILLTPTRLLMQDLKVLLGCSITADQARTPSTISSLPKAPIMLQYSYIYARRQRSVLLNQSTLQHQSCSRIPSKPHCEHPHQGNQSHDQTEILCQTIHSVHMDIPPKYEANEEEAATVARSQQIWSTMWQPTENPSAQSPPPTTIKSADKPFRVALIMTRTSETYALQPSKRLKVKCGSVMMRRDTSEAEFRRLLWECIYDTFELRGWRRAPRTDAELASGKKYATPDEWRKTIESLVKERDAGQDPVLRISFSWKNGKRVNLEAESKLSFSLKRMLDRVVGRW